MLALPLKPFVVSSRRQQADGSRERRAGRVRAPVFEEVDGRRRRGRRQILLLPVDSIRISVNPLMHERSTLGVGSRPRTSLFSEADAESKSQQDRKTH